MRNSIQAPRNAVSSSRAARCSVLRSEVGEFNAEAATVAERDEQDRVRQAKIQLDGIAPENIAEQGGELLAGLGPDKQMYPRPESQLAGHPLLGGLLPGSAAAAVAATRSSAPSLASRTAARSRATVSPRRRKRPSRPRLTKRQDQGPCVSHDFRKLSLSPRLCLGCRRSGE